MKMPLAPLVALLAGTVLPPAWSEVSAGPVTIWIKLAPGEDPADAAIVSAPMPTAGVLSAYLSSPAPDFELARDIGAISPAPAATVFNDPAFRYEDASVDVWTPKNISLGEKMSGIVRALEAARVAPESASIPAFQQDPDPAGRTAFPEVGRPLSDQTIVEGSKKGGGAQPDFLIDHADPILRDRLLAPARLIGAEKLDDWAKLRKLQALVHFVLPGDGYSEGPEKQRYDGFVASVGNLAQVSLGEYIRLGVGVCRENALLTVVALRAAGYKARFAYFKVFKDNNEFDQDHALALVEVGGTTYALDSYALLGRYYNGHRLADLLQPPADGKYPLASPLAVGNGSDPGRWRMVLNHFPRTRSAP